MSNWRQRERERKRHKLICDMCLCALIVFFGTVMGIVLALWESAIR